MTLQTTMAPEGATTSLPGDAITVPDRTDIGDWHVVDYATPYPYRDRHHRRHVRALDRHVGRWS